MKYFLILVINRSEKLGKKIFLFTNKNNVTDTKFCYLLKKRDKEKERKREKERKTLIAIDSNER